MSESRRRKAEIAEIKRAHQQWLDGLSTAERVVAEVCERAYVNIVERRGLVAGCYLLAFFLHELFEEKHGISTELVVGWINDGEWSGVASHAWLETNGKKIDLALGRMDMPEAQPTGDVIILDHVLRRGAAHYTYYREAPADATAAIEAGIQSGELPRWIVDSKNTEHAHVLELSKTREGVKTYLLGAPSDRAYSALARAVD